MQHTRRHPLIRAASLATVGVGSTLVTGQDDDESMWQVVEVDAEDEYVAF